MISRAVVACVFAVLTVAGCGGSKPAEPEATSTSSAAGVAPATGDLVSTDEYSYNVPKGWKEHRGDTPGFDFDSVATDPGDKDGFSDNINVIRVGTAPSDDLGQFEDESEKELTRLGAKEVKVLPRQSVDGSESIHITASTSLNGTEYRTNQYGMVHNDIVFVVTFSFSVDVSAAAQDELIQSVLATWKWAS